MTLAEYMRDNILILDGGMGSLLQKAGLAPGEYPESWNIIHPDVIENIHREYFDSGSNAVLTNTFGANSLKFSQTELSDVVAAAVENAKRARAASNGGQEKFIALDIGPTGKMLKPYGDLDFEDAVKIFGETVSIGAKLGVDFIFIETMSDCAETKAALLAAKENSSLPVFVSNAYGIDGKLLTGSTPEAMVAMLEGMGADAVGCNCSLGPQQLSGVVGRLLKSSSVPVIMKPNAGLPSERDGKTVYDIDAQQFAQTVKTQVLNGVRIIGGCCGTTPEYIGLLKKAVMDLKPVPVTEKNETVVSSYAKAVAFSKPLLIGERINPTGKKRLRQALTDRDMGYILETAISQQDAGAHILDVNTGIPGIDEKEILTAAIRELQTVTELPLQIDSSDPAALESAMRAYIGKPMINSVNGKKESMEAVFPLVKKYGGVLVALTLDENGIPETAQGKFEIAEKIIFEAEKYGISRKNIVFDALTMAVSADPKSAGVTLKALRMIKEKLHCGTVLGVSNISFGLPERDKINSVFFTMALENGLSAAIMNPLSGEMMNAYYSFLALSGHDEGFSEYIAHSAPTEPKKAEAEPPATLRRAIIKGLKSEAAALTAQMLRSENPLDIINEKIIPALDEVGSGFEAKTVFLPQLLMSAEAARCAFEEIKKAVPVSDKEKKFTVVLATVKGDIHDIGKNIVRLLLENYGYEVDDLGKDVSPETVLKAVLDKKAPLLGLSALMTTTVPSMEETVALVKKEAPFCRVIVGGAVLTKEYAEKIGADAYSKDAMETVRYAERLLKQQ